MRTAEPVEETRGAGVALDGQPIGRGGFGVHWDGGARRHDGKAEPERIHETGV